MADDTPDVVMLRDRLLKLLDERCPKIDLLEAYYDGRHPLPKPPARLKKYREAATAFDTLSRVGVTNYVKLVADAPAERLRPVGFRFGESTEGDSDAWKLWQENELDADAGVLHHSAIVTGGAFALVWPAADGVTITLEHGGQAIVAYQPGSRRRRRAGLKRWAEDDGTRRVVLYLADEVYKWRTERDNGPLVEWQPPTDDSWPILNPFAPDIPLVEFRCNPSLRPALYGGGRGDFEGVLPIQDRINKTVFDRLVTAEFQAFRQRWAIGWTPDSPMDAIRASASTLMAFEDPNVKVGEFAQADFSAFIGAVKSDVEAMAAITRTPSFYTLGNLVNPPSGDALMALQAGLVARTEAHRDNFSESWEDVMRLALRAVDDERWQDRQSMMLWGDIEHVTWTENANAMSLWKALGVPDEELWSRLHGVTPQDVERWKLMVADRELVAPVAVAPA